MSDSVRNIKTGVLTIPRDTPYLGKLLPGETLDDRGYIVRRNGTVYPSFDRSVLVCIETRDGVIGWGETYGIVAPGAVTAIIDDLLSGFVVGRDPWDAMVIHDELYDLMRVRGYSSGFYMDALAAIDIALWDICGKQSGKPLAKLLGGKRRHSIPAYVSGLPCPTQNERSDLAAKWQSRGFDMFKTAGVAADIPTLEEIAHLRERLGDNVKIAIDYHWAYTAADAIEIIRSLEPHRPWFVEAPCKSEDIDGQARIATAVRVPIALGEEWRTVFDVRLRLDRQAVSIIQPEMGHTGVTEFVRMAQLAEAHHLQTIPHATIGLGIFLAASLQVSASIRSLPAHEYQHSIFDRNQYLITGDMRCEKGAYSIPTGPGLGVEPSEEALRMIEYS
ncbi:MAG: D-galactarolactone cycloisomerase [Candidatus Moanabacter tarae]|uniref:D-galactarolactone cycloisomerase n=1 Tax=Candidatus Moanibacter tarae TaxID=2200854 RepID=A0A2Z4AGN9_9BACT|nr:MAG: D-galactarolactone cycloisomerase [Candidatus Moanabacter tarae]|tara:strand:- start:851 stop:2017 length:1167 start_codon:yes stop_codon:yes gene_type:complete